MEFRRDLLGVRFVSDDGKLAFTIHDAAGPEKDRFPLEVTAESVPSGERLLDRAPASWTPREDPQAEGGRARLDRVMVELGVAGMGDTWNLLFARPTDDRSRYHGYDWIAVTEDSPVAEMAVFPEFGGNPFGGMEWDWQDGWWYPYSTFRAAR